MQVKLPALHDILTFFLFSLINQDGNNAGEYLVYTAEGNIMIFTDSDTVGPESGMGFLLLTPD